MRPTGFATRLLGKPTIHPVAFALGKLSMALCYGLALVQLAGIRVWARAPVALERVALGLAVVGVALLIVSSAWLGSALRVGLPRTETTLRTTGVYAWSRNPIYLSLLLLYLAACLYAPHPLVIGCALVSAVVHHRIALAEERFLEKRFGTAWRVYRARVPRYFGVPHRTRQE